MKIAVGPSSAHCTKIVHPFPILPFPPVWEFGICICVSVEGRTYRLISLRLVRNSVFHS